MCRAGQECSLRLQPVFVLVILEPVAVREAFLEWLVVGSSCFSIRFAIVFVAV